MTTNEFVNLNTTVSASLITQNTVTFNNVNTASVMSGMVLLSTDTTNSLFFINGVYIYSDRIQAIQNTGSHMFVVFDTASLQYDLEIDDSIIAVGKFNII